jgi:hypothetical protein
MLNKQKGRRTKERKTGTNRGTYAGRLRDYFDRMHFHSLKIKWYFST